MWKVILLSLMLGMQACGNIDSELKDIDPGNEGKDSNLLHHEKYLHDSNSERFEFVEINSGSFEMGSPKDEVDRREDEVLHSVGITKNFKMMKHEVSQAQWKAVMGESENRSYFKGDDLPVESVTWNDVQAFIHKLNEGTDRCGDTTTAEGFKKAWSTSGCYRLPTEAEWEYAARAGTKTPFFSGENITTDQANYDGNNPYRNYPRGKNRERTEPVGAMSESSNVWGLMHMSGNVWEWTQDLYGAYDLKVKEDPMGAVSGEFRVVRGGSWVSVAQGVRSALRAGLAAEKSLVHLGFRLVRTL